jgi:UDP-2,3-diacylglucosamine pyrophosphatase LpxH
MPVAVVADAHLGGPGGAAEPLVRQLDRLARPECERLLFLGDLFQVWVGSARFETRDVRSIVGALQRLRERRITLHYVEGNRDFFLAESVYASFFDTVGTEFAFESAGKRYLAVHGDGINREDYLYRFWRRVSKNRLSRWAMLHLPSRLANRIIHGFEHELAKTNFRHKVALPAEAIEEYARRRLAEGFDSLLLGHFHEPFRKRLEGGQVIVFDAWFRSRRVDWLGVGGGSTADDSA